MTTPEYEIFLDGRPKKVELTKTGESSFAMKIDGKPRNVDLIDGALNTEKPLTVKIDNKPYKVELTKIDREKQFSIKVEEAAFRAEVKIPAKKVASTTFEPVLVTSTKKTAANKQGLEGAVTAPMTGKIASVKVKPGDQVKAKQVLCVIEAMKMENEITAVRDGTVQEVLISAGQSVSEGEPLLIVA